MHVPLHATPILYFIHSVMRTKLCSQWVPDTSWFFTIVLRFSSTHNFISLIPVALVELKMHELSTYYHPHSLHQVWKNKWETPKITYFVVIISLGNNCCCNKEEILNLALIWILVKIIITHVEFDGTKI